MKGTLTIIIAALVIACSPEIPKEEMPEVNDENCQTDIIEKIRDKGTREKFASLCFRRGPIFKPSSNYKW